MKLRSRVRILTLQKILFSLYYSGLSIITSRDRIKDRAYNAVTTFAEELSPKSLIRASAVLLSTPNSSLEHSEKSELFSELKSLTYGLIPQEPTADSIKGLQDSYACLQTISKHISKEESTVLYKHFSEAFGAIGVYLLLEEASMNKYIETLEILSSFEKTSQNFDDIRNIMESSVYALEYYWKTLEPDEFLKSSLEFYPYYASLLRGFRKNSQEILEIFMGNAIMSVFISLQDSEEILPMTLEICLEIYKHCPRYFSRRTKSQFNSFFKDYISSLKSNNEPEELVKWFELTLEKLDKKRIIPLA